MFAKIRRAVMQFSGDWQTDKDRLVKAIQKYDDDLERPGAIHLSEFTLDTYETTPTPTSGSGAFTSVSGAVSSSIAGDRCIFTATVTITTNNTAATDVRIALPVIAAESTGFGGIMTGNVGLAASIASASSMLIIARYDGAYPGADGRVLRISGAYKV